VSDRVTILLHAGSLDGLPRVRAAAGATVGSLNWHDGLPCCQHLARQAAERAYVCMGHRRLAVSCKACAGLHVRGDHAGEMACCTECARPAGTELRIAVDVGPVDLVSAEDGTLAPAFTGQAVMYGPLRLCDTCLLAAPADLGGAA
jgi:hypothetical protein